MSALSKRAVGPMVAAALITALAGCGDGTSQAARQQWDWTEPADQPAPATSPAATMDPSTAANDEASTAPEVGRTPATIPPPREIDAPTALRMTGVDIDAAVVPVGVEGDGQMELPLDPNVVGWYRHGSTVGGGTGSVVLAGHVDSRKFGVGQLERLRESSIDDVIVVSATSGVDWRYRVVEVRHVPRARLPLAEIFSRDGAERLVVITCGGAYDPDTGYEDNVIVTAVPE